MSAKAPLKQQKVQPRFKKKGLWRRLVTPRRLAVLGVLAAVGLGVFTFFYVKYSRIIDAKLRGEVFVRTSGIYAQPPTIKAGQSLSMTDLRTYLDRIGYVESATATDQRGHYSVNGQTMTVEPSHDALVDNALAFPALNVTFSKNSEAIVRIVDKTTNKQMQSAEIEPELLSSVSNADKEKRLVVGYDELPVNLTNAIIAIEDRRFLEHRGVDYRGLARAVWINITNREVQQGGSTLTQQLVKNMFLTPEKTYKRKLEEAFIAIVIETKLSKEQIMQLYCNEVFLGQQGNYSLNGFGEASRAYFDKDVSKLDLKESALLAGMIRGPSLYNPFSNQDKAIERRNAVLDAMAEMNFISSQQAEDTKKLDIGVRERRAVANADAPYFLDYLQTELGAEFPGMDLSRQSLRIYSTIDMNLQRAAERAVRDNLAALDKIYAGRKTDAVPPGTLQAALVAIDPHTGEILALVGGRDYEKSQLNRATDANRQPGSVFKPIVYATALETAYTGEQVDAITAVTPFLDSPEKFYTANGDVYEPDNYGKSYSNKSLPLREGLVKSLNVITVRVAEKVGLFQIQQIATKLGLPKPPPYLSIALGTTEATPMQVAGAYSAFANLGLRVKPTGLKRVTDGQGSTIKALRPETSQALHPQVAYIMTDFMKDVLNRGTAAGARSRGFTSLAAGKTGTSRDGWFAGYTPNLVCVVYVGFDDGSQLGLEGSKSALPIWTDFMKSALRMRPDLGGDEFQKPVDGVVEADVDPESGELVVQGCGANHKVELFVDGTQPRETCSLHSGPEVISPDGQTDDKYGTPPFKTPDGKEPLPGKPRPPPPLPPQVKVPPLPKPKDDGPPGRPRRVRPKDERR